MYVRGCSSAQTRGHTGSAYEHTVTSQTRHHTCTDLPPRTSTSLTVSNYGALPRRWYASVPPLHADSPHAPARPAVFLSSLAPSCPRTLRIRSPGSHALHNGRQFVREIGLKRPERWGRGFGCDCGISMSSQTPMIQVPLMTRSCLQEHAFPYTHMPRRQSTHGK